MSEFERCIERKGLVRFTGGRADVVTRELEAAKADLAAANDSLAQANWKWAIVQGYYSMFHGARGLVLKAGYVEKSHYCLGIAFRELHGKEGAGLELAEALSRARTLREDADYESEYDDGAARSVCVSAERFLAFAQAEANRP